MQGCYCFHNAKVIDRGEIAPEGELWVWHGRLQAPPEGVKAQAVHIDAAGMYLAPGFIDLHVHGGAGFDFMDANPAEYAAICEMHLRHGTTALLATTLAGEWAEVDAVLEAFGAAQAKNPGARLLGVHLEGPYFSPAQRGAQDPAYLQSPDPARYRALAQNKAVKRWSAAPELPGAMEMGRYLSENGVVASIGHSNADMACVAQAVHNGYTLVTHLYSGTSGVHRVNGFRRGGVVEAAFLQDELYVELIADGCHLPPDMLRMVYKLKGPLRCALVTDAMRAAGQPPGESILGSRKRGRRVVVEEDVAWLPDKTAFAGSVATADRLLQTAYRAGIPLGHAIQMLTETPARILGLYPELGTLATGARADLVLLDNRLRVCAVMAGGSYHEF